MFDKLGGITAIQAHVASLTAYLYRGLSALRHSNGAPLVQVFGKHHLPNAPQVNAPWSRFVHSHPPLPLPSAPRCRPGASRPPRHHTTTTTTTPPPPPSHHHHHHHTTTTTTPTATITPPPPPAYAQVQGGILNFEVLAPSGQALSYKAFEKEAADAGFHVRTGSECNPGACYNYLGIEVRARLPCVACLPCWCLPA
jgi:hypothetical protein